MLLLRKALFLSCALLLMNCTLLQTGRATELLVNGGFETGGGGFFGWGITDQAAGCWCLQTGTVTPTTGFPVPPPPDGLNSAIADGFSPGAHVLLQSFTVPANSTGLVLQFYTLLGNRTGSHYITPNTLDYTINGGNIQARVDILTAGATPFAVDAGSVIQNVFQTGPGSQLIDSQWQAHAVDVTSALGTGGTFQIRFAEADSAQWFYFGVDGVSLATNLPELATFALIGVGLVIIGWKSYRRRH